MLVSWISSDNASWRKVVEALLSPLIHNDNVASEIASKHKKWQLVVVITILIV